MKEHGQEARNYAEHSPRNFRRRGVGWSALVVAGAIGIAASVVGTALPASAATQLGGVDMQRACNNQYPGMGLRATVLDPGNAYSWRCRAPWGYTAGLNLNAACNEQYGGGAWATPLDPRNAYSWRCYR